MWNPFNRGGNNTTPSSPGGVENQPSNPSIPQPGASLSPEGIAQAPTSLISNEAPAAVGTVAPESQQPISNDLGTTAPWAAERDSKMAEVGSVGSGSTNLTDSSPEIAPSFPETGTLPTDASAEATTDTSTITSQSSSQETPDPMAVSNGSDTSTGLEGPSTQMPENTTPASFGTAPEAPVANATDFNAAGNSVSTPTESMPPVAPENTEPAESSPTAADAASAPLEPVPTINNAATVAEVSTANTNDAGEGTDSSTPISETDTVVTPVNDTSLGIDEAQASSAQADENTSGTTDANSETVTAIGEQNATNLGNDSGPEEDKDPIPSTPISSPELPTSTPNTDLGTQSSGNETTTPSQDIVSQAADVVASAEAEGGALPTATSPESPVKTEAPEPTDGTGAPPTPTPVVA